MDALAALAALTAGVLQRPTMPIPLAANGPAKQMTGLHSSRQQHPQATAPAKAAAAAAAERHFHPASSLSMKRAHSLSLSLFHTHLCLPLSCWLSPSLCRVSRLQTWFDITRWHMRNDSAEEIYEESSQLISSREKFELAYFNGGRASC